MFTFKLPVSFTGSYIDDEPNFPRQNNLVLQKIVASIDKVVNFKDFSWPNKEIKYFSRTLTEFKDFSTRMLNFKTLKKPWRNQRKIERNGLPRCLIPPSNGLPTATWNLTDSPENPLYCTYWITKICFSLTRFNAKLKKLWTLEIPLECYRCNELQGKGQLDIWVEWVSHSWQPSIETIL